MARPKKQTASKAEVDLKTLEIARVKEIEALYNDLAKIKRYVDSALYQVGTIDSSENLAEAAFKAGKAYGSLDKANDRLQDVLQNLYETYDVEHWEDIYEN